MLIEDYRITKVRDYIFEILQKLLEETIEKYQININFLPNEIDNYSIDKIPVKTETSIFITDECICRDVYEFRSRTLYSTQVDDNLKNIGFYEKFEKKIKENNKKGLLPKIDGIESIECLNCGSLNDNETSTAVFSIQVQIEYMEVQDEDD